MPVRASETYQSLTEEDRNAFLAEYYAAREEAELEQALQLSLLEASSPLKADSEPAQAPADADLPADPALQACIPASFHNIDPR